MKITKILLFIIIIITLYSCKNNQDTNNEKIQINKEYYASGKLKEEIPYKNGKINGLVKVYYESGKIMVIFPMKDDITDGIQKRFYEDGILESEI